MAVSHDWFIEWSPPVTVFADITREYEGVNVSSSKVKWYKPLPANSAHPAKSYSTYRSPYYQNKHNVVHDKVYPRTPSTARSKAASQAAALSFWMTMLGLARPQSIPADFETPPFNTLYKWKHVDFEFPSKLIKVESIKNGKFIPQNVLPLGLEVWESRIWVTLPRWRRGVPVTLATVPRLGGLTSPALKPYPNWNFHRALYGSNECVGLTSVFRIKADSCGRLWVMDSGQIDSQDKPKQICPPTIVVFNLRNDTLIAKYPIPKQFVLQNSLFANIIIDSRKDDCSDLHVYIADTWRFGLIVFRHSDETFWRFTHPLFYPDPLASNYTLQGINFQWMDGIFGLALTPSKQISERILFFHPMSSYREFYVSTSVLRDPWRVSNSNSAFKIAGESRGLFGQSSASVIDRRGVMFFGLVSSNSIGCWDTKKKYNKNTTGIVARNSETLVFPNDIKIDQEEEQSLWVISNKLPIFQAGKLNADDYNYRIMYADVEEAVKRSICDPAETEHESHG